MHMKIDDKKHFEKMKSTRFWKIFASQLLLQSIDFVLKSHTDLTEKQNYYEHMYWLFYPLIFHRIFHFNIPEQKEAKGSWWMNRTNGASMVTHTHLHSDL